MGVKGTLTGCRRCVATARGLLRLPYLMDAHVADSHVDARSDDRVVDDLALGVLLHIRDVTHTDLARHRRVLERLVVPVRWDGDGMRWGGVGWDGMR
jgi:hypothetical protein